LKKYLQVMLQLFLFKYLVILLNLLSSIIKNMLHPTLSFAHRHPIVVKNILSKLAEYNQLNPQHPWQKVLHWRICISINSMKIKFDRKDPSFNLPYSFLLDRANSDANKTTLYLLSGEGLNGQHFIAEGNKTQMRVVYRLEFCYPANKPMAIKLFTHMPFSVKIYQEASRRPPSPISELTKESFEVLEGMTLNYLWYWPTDKRYLLGLLYPGVNPITYFNSLLSKDATPPLSSSIPIEEQWIEFSSKADSTLPFTKKLCFAYSMALNLHNFHVTGKVHNDIKAENFIWYEEYDQVTSWLIDEDFICTTDATVTEIKATFNHCDPCRLASGYRATPASDMYSFALTLLTVIFNYAPPQYGENWKQHINLLENYIDEYTRRKIINDSQGCIELGKNIFDYVRGIIEKCKNLLTRYLPTAVPAFEPLFQALYQTTSANMTERLTATQMMQTIADTFQTLTGRDIRMTLLRTPLPVIYSNKAVGIKTTEPYVWQVDLASWQITFVN